MATHYLFVYGTLLKDTGNNMAQFLKEHSEDLGKSYFYGKLYLVSWYPGAILSKNDSYKVFGKLFKLKDAKSVLSVLNDYEGVDKHYPESSLFRKEEVTVYLKDNKKLKAWVYLFNLSTEGLKEIPSGDFLETF